MSKPGGPPKPRERPADCPKDAAYIRLAPGAEGGTVHLPSTDFPLVFEGGDGNDEVVLERGGGKGVLVFGGMGDDRLIVGDSWARLMNRMAPSDVVFLATLALVLALVGVTVWRALAQPRH